MSEANEKIDLDNPKDAKFFLRGVRFSGKPIEFVDLADGRRLAINDMTDEQLVRYAKDIYFDYCGGIQGKSGLVELDENAREQ